MLVPLDGSAEAAAAIDPALRIARSLQIPLELLTVHDPVHGTWAKDIDGIADRLVYEHVEVALVGAGWAGDVIVSTVTEQPGTAVCMATHNRDRFSRLVAGSVTEHVLHQVSAPVLMIGPHYQPSETDAHFQRALVCQDGTPRDASSLAMAESWARQLKLELELVHVAAPGEKDRAEARLHEATERLREEGLTATATIETSTEPADRITEVLAQRPGALAILNGHARVGLSKFVLGSVSSTLLERSPIPLVITRSP
jgi:nucleotide-binding universal stress UspA family protein